MKSQVMKGAVLSILVGGLAACSGAGFDIGKTKAFDGRWAGRMTLSIGEKDCLRRQGFSAKVVNGGFAGEAKDGKNNISMSGWLEEDGTLRRGSIRMYTNGPKGSLSGKFQEKTAEGRWKTDECSGRWRLRHVSDRVPEDEGFSLF